MTPGGTRCSINCWFCLLCHRAWPEFDCAYPTWQPGPVQGYREVLGHCSRGGKAQSELWESWSWLGFGP